MQEEKLKNGITKKRTAAVRFFYIKITCFCIKMHYFLPFRLFFNRIEWSFNIFYLSLQNEWQFARQ